MRYKQKGHILVNLGQFEDETAPNQCSNLKFFE